MIAMFAIPFNIVLTFVFAILAKGFFILPIDLFDFPNIFDILPNPETIGFIALNATIPPSIIGIILAIMSAFSINALPNFPNDGNCVPNASVIA